MLPHSVLVYELELLVKAGLTPGEALSAATVVAAWARGLSELVDTLEAGKSAALITVAGDSPVDVSVVRVVRTVVARGQLGKHERAPIPVQYSDIGEVRP